MPTVEAELRNAAEEFFKRTRAWREWLPDAIVFEAGVTQATISPPDDSYVVQIEKATDASNNTVAVRGAFSLSTPAETQDIGGVSSVDRQLIDLLSPTHGGTELRLQCSLAPTQDSAGLPDYIAQQYGAEIAEGAVHRIRSLPLLLDAGQAALALDRFERDIARVGALVHRTHTSSTPRIRPTWC